MVRRVSLALVGFALTLGAARAGAQSEPNLSTHDPGPEARARFELAYVLSEQERWDEAGAQFERAYEASDVAALLYNAFVCYRRADMPRDALRTLNEYLRLETPDDEDRAELEAQRAALEGLVEALAAEGTEEEATPDRGAPPEEPAAQAAAGPSEASEGGGGPDLVGPAILLAVGGGVLAGSAVTGALVVTRDADLADRCAAGCSTADQDAIDEGRTLALVTDVLWISGATVAAAGLVWLIVAAASGGSDDARARRAGLEVSF